MVGFEVEASSVGLTALQFDGDNCLFPLDGTVAPQEIGVSRDALSLQFTYSVQWLASDVSWASRWDIYLGMTDVQIHWFSIVNSLVVVFFLSGKFCFSVIYILKALFNMNFILLDWSKLYGFIARLYINFLLRRTLFTSLYIANITFFKYSFC